MNTLGIDQSFTCTGLVVVDENEEVIGYKLINTDKDKEDTYTNFRRAKKISDEIVEYIISMNIDKVHIEGLGFGASGDATRNLAGLQYLIVNECLDRGIEPLIVAPTSLKKFATGSGKAKKTEVFESIEDSNPSFFKDLLEVKKTKGRYDLADAYWLAVFKSPTK